MPTFLVSAKDYASENGLSEGEVIEKIKNATLDGKEDDECWKVRIDKAIVPQDENTVAGSVLTIKHVMPPHRAPYNRRTL